MGESSSFGKYQLLRKLAVGGMAEVFLARQRGIAGFEKLLVVKRILPEIAADPEFVTMFLDEARLAASMTHPNLVQIYDLGEVGDSYFLAMEYVPGPDLLTILRAHGKRGQRMPYEISARILANVAEALSYAHNHKDARGTPLRLIHRDVTPSNVLVSYDGTTKLVDFGIAKAETSAKTSDGRVKGKTRYLAPEQLTQDPLDARVDIWALGICLYEAMTGTRPIRGDNDLALMKSILESEIVPPREVDPELPPALDAIIMSCLQRDPSLRMPNADQLRRQLEAHLKTSEVASSPHDVGTYLKSFFSTEHQDLERSIRELAAVSKVELEAVAKMPSMGLDVTPSDAGIRPPTSTRANVPPKLDLDSPAPKSRAAPVALGLTALALLVAGGWFAMRPAAGTLSVRSEPPGAQIRLGSVLLGDRTPAQLKALPFGKQTLLLTLDGYEDASAEVILDDEHIAEAVAVVLVKRKAAVARLKVSTTPAAERLFLDGAKQGIKEGAVELEVAPDQPHTLLAEREGHHPASTTITAKPGATETVSLALAVIPAPTTPERPRDPPPPPVSKAKRQATLDFETEPPTEVSLAGQSLGMTPLRGVRVASGDLVLTCSNETLSLRQTVRLTVSADENVKKKVVFAKGKLVIDVQPWADVYLGAKKLGTTPFPPREFYEGTYTLKLVNAEIGALHNLTAIVQAGQTTLVKHDLGAK